MHTSETTKHSGAKSRPIVFFGTEDFSLASLQTLVESGFNIVAVVTKPDSLRGRGRHLAEPAVKTYAVSHGITVWQPRKLVEIMPDIESLNHPAGVLVSYGKIIPQSIIDIFDPGIINVHPSLLPIYRGPSPIESAIENRDAKTGVTIMQLSAAMDAGPIYYQVPYALDFTETRPELYATLSEIGAHILAQQLPSILNGTLFPVAQDDSQVSYCKLLSKSDSLIDPMSLTPGGAEARIRAHLGFPRTKIRLGEHEVIVTKAHGVMTKKSPLDIECTNGAFLSIDELIAPSGKTMSGETFLRGYSL